MVKGFGIREFFALGALVVAVVIASQFLDPSASESKANPTVVHLGEPPTAAIPATPAPTATPVRPPHRLSPPATGWAVGFYETGFTQPADQAFVPDLNFSFPKAPFPDYKDDHWSLRATAQFQVEDGPSSFRLRYAGEVTVTVDGTVVASGAPGGTKTLDVRFDHPAGSATVSIEAKDVSGPFELTWLND
jgi:hypothetical protein